MRRRDVLIPLSSHPFAVYLLALCVVSGATALLFGRATPGIPGWLTVLWYVLLVAGGVVGLAGLVWPDAIAGLLIERASMVFIGVGAYLYAVPVAYTAGPVAAVTVAGFGVCAHWRVVQITRQTRRRQ